MITPQQATRMGAAVIMEIEAKKDAFLRIKGGNVTQLRKQLQILFTRIVVKRITIKLEKSKKIVEEKLEKIAVEEEKRNQAGGGGQELNAALG